MSYLRLLERAEAAWTKGDKTRSVRLLREAEAHAAAEVGTGTAAELLLERCRIMAQEGEKHDPQSVLLAFDHYERDARDLRERLRVAIDRAEALSWLDEVAECHLAWQRAIELADESGDNRARLEARLQLGCRLGLDGRRADGYLLLNETLELSKTLQDTELIARTYRQLGIFAINAQDVHKAAREYSAAVTHYLAAGLHRDAAKCLELLAGVAHANKGMWSMVAQLEPQIPNQPELWEAHYAILLGLTTAAASHGMISLNAEDERDTGPFYTRLGDVGLALQYALKAWSLAIRCPSCDIRPALSHVSSLLFDAGEHSAALQCADQFLEYTTDRETRALFVWQTGEAARGNSVCRQWILANTSVVIAAGVQDTHILAHLHYLRARVLLESGRVDEATEHLEECDGQFESPDHLRVEELRARIAIQRREFSRAVEICRTALGSIPVADRALVNRSIFVPNLILLQITALAIAGETVPYTLVEECTVSLDRCLRGVTVSILRRWIDEYDLYVLNAITSCTTSHNSEDELDVSARERWARAALTLMEVIRGPETLALDPNPTGNIGVKPDPGRWSGAMFEEGRAVAANVFFASRFVQRELLRSVKTLIDGSFDGAAVLAYLAHETEDSIDVRTVWISPGVASGIDRFNVSKDAFVLLSDPFFASEDAVSVEQEYAALFEMGEALIPSGLADLLVAGKVPELVVIPSEEMWLVPFFGLIVRERSPLFALTVLGLVLSAHHVDVSGHSFHEHLPWGQGIAACMDETVDGVEREMSVLRSRFDELHVLPIEEVVSPATRLSAYAIGILGGHGIWTDAGVAIENGKESLRWQDLQGRRLPSVMVLGFCWAGDPISDNALRARFGFAQAVSASGPLAVVASAAATDDFFLSGVLMAFYENLAAHPDLGPAIAFSAAIRATVDPADLEVRPRDWAYLQFLGFPAHDLHLHKRVRQSKGAKGESGKR